MSDDSVWLKPPQINTLRNACYETGASYLQARNDAMIALAYDSGLRPNELVNVTVEMVDFEDSCLRIPGRIQKDYPTEGSPPPATIGLCDDEYTHDTLRTIRQYLDSRWKDSPYLFPSRKSNQASTSSYRRMVTSVAEQSAVRPYQGFEGRVDPDDVHPHAFRHSVAYRLLRARDNPANMYEVRDRLRHRSLQTTEQKYDHFDRR